MRVLTTAMLAALMVAGVSTASFAQDKNLGSGTTSGLEPGEGEVPTGAEQPIVAPDHDLGSGTTAELDGGEGEVPTGEEQPLIDEDINVGSGTTMPGSEN